MQKIITATAIVFFLFVLWIIYLADTGGQNMFFDFIRSFPYGDKVGHFCLFGTLTFGAILASKFKTFNIAKLNVYYAVALVSLFILSEEISQAFIPSRTFDLVDLAADTLGILAAIALANMAKPSLLKRT